MGPCLWKVDWWAIMGVISFYLALGVIGPCPGWSKTFYLSGLNGKDNGRVPFPPWRGRHAAPEIVDVQGQRRVYVAPPPKRVSKLGSVEIKEMSNKTSIRRHKIKYGQGKQVRLCLGAWGRSISRLAGQESCPFSSSTLQISLRLVDRLSPILHWQTTCLTPTVRN